MAAAPQESRALGFWLCLSLCIGTFIGSGIFLLPAQLAPYGWNAVFAWLITIGGALCLAYVFARLARALPEAAGPYAYVDHAFGPAAAFTVAWSYWISTWVGNAGIAVAAIAYLSPFAPGLTATPLAATVSSVVLIWLLTLLNCFSLRGAGRFQLLTVLVKLVPLLVVAGLAILLFGRGQPLAAAPLRSADLSLSGINAAATLTLWAMLGLEAPAIASRAVRDPERTVPRATLIGTLIVGLLYLATATPIDLFLPAGELAASDTPFNLFVGRFWDPGLARLLGLFAAISCIGALNGLTLVQGELPLAMARHGAFPRWFAQTTKRGTAARAILLSSTLATLLLAAKAGGTVGQVFTFMILLSTAGALILYLACALAALRLQWTGLMPRAVGLSMIAAAAALYSLWTLYGAGYDASFWGVILLAAGIPVYLLMRLAARSSRAAAAPPAASPESAA